MMERDGDETQTMSRYTERAKHLGIGYNILNDIRLLDLREVLNQRTHLTMQACRGSCPLRELLYAWWTNGNGSWKFSTTLHSRIESLVVVSRRGGHTTISHWFRAVEVVGSKSGGLFPVLS